MLTLFDTCYCYFDIFLLLFKLDIIILKDNCKEKKKIGKLKKMLNRNLASHNITSSDHAMR